MDTGYMERNVFCVKWGTKYSADDVNRLYRMVERNITGPFKFYCFTEDQKDLYPEVNIIPLDDSLRLERYWWKLTMFKDNIVGGDINLYFDLDVVIQNNINHLFNAHPTKLTIIDTSFYDDNDNFEQGSYTYYNSSILCWKNNTQQFIYDKFIEQIDFWMNVYIGIDRFMFNEIDSKHFTPWDKKVWYFRTKLQVEGPPNDGKVKHPDPKFFNGRSGSLGVYYFPDYTVCIFNQSHYPEFYKGFEKYFL